MEVSAVIVNFNGKNMADSFIKSLNKSSFKSFETLIADNGSTDGSIDHFKKIGVKVVENKKNLGYSGINSALKYCKGKYILFLNNDMEIDRDCIKNLVKAIESDENIAMAAPRLINYYDKNLKSDGTWVSRAFYNGHLKGDTVNEIPYLGVGLIRKSFVDMFGYLFDPDYFIYAEDLDLGLRIRLNGKKAIFVPNAIMYHMHAATMQKSSQQFSTFLMERNLLTTFFKIMSLENILLFLPYVLFARVAAVIKDISTLKFNIAFSRIKAIFYVFFNFNNILKKRKQIQKFRKVSDGYILQVFSEKYLFKPKFVV